MTSGMSDLSLLLFILFAVIYIAINYLKYGNMGNTNTKAARFINENPRKHALLNGVTVSCAALSAFDEKLLFLILVFGAALYFTIFAVWNVRSKWVEKLKAQV
jgi:hypothetical protein